MAIQSDVVIRSERDVASARRRFLGESVSWDSDVGQNVSWRPTGGVPAGRLWQVQTLYAHNGEAGPVQGMFVLLDDSDSATDHARFAGGSSVVPVPVPGGAALSWTGQLWVPAGWKVGVKLLGMQGAGYCHWRYTAIELSWG